MSTYNIEMNSYNGSNYDVLYPKTVLNNITNWNSNIYSKAQIDSTISDINDKISKNEEAINQNLESITKSKGFCKKYGGGTYTVNGKYVVISEIAEDIIINSYGAIAIIKNHSEIVYSGSLCISDSNDFEYGIELIDIYRLGRNDIRQVQVSLLNNYNERIYVFSDEHVTNGTNNNIECGYSNYYCGFFTHNESLSETYQIEATLYFFDLNFIINNFVQ